VETMSPTAMRPAKATLAASIIHVPFQQRPQLFSLFGNPSPRPNPAGERELRSISLNVFVIGGALRAEETG